MVNVPNDGTSDVWYVVFHVIILCFSIESLFYYSGFVYTTRKSRNVILGSREKGA